MPTLSVNRINNPSVAEKFIVAATKSPMQPSSLRAMSRADGDHE
jgi:hypothetical protein